MDNNNMDNNGLLYGSKYGYNRAMRKTRRRMRMPEILAVILFAAAASLPAFCTPARAADIYYDGDPSDLQLSPTGIGIDFQVSSIYPGTLANPLSSDNNVSVDYVPAPPSTKDPVKVFGGIGIYDDSRGNTVTINNGAFGNNGCIYGGYVYGSGSAIGNKVYVNGFEGVPNLLVYGGYAKSAAGYSTYAAGNEVYFSGGTAGGLRGGFADNCENNIVYIEGGTVTNEVVGGEGSSKGGAVTGNAVHISGGYVGGYYVCGGTSSGTSAMSENSVVVTGGTILKNVFGAYDFDGNANSKLERNYVVMSNGVVSGDVAAASSRNGSVTANSATLSGGTVVGNVIGGISNRNNAEGNTVTITGGSVGGGVWGGSTASGDAADNRVEISGVDIGGAVYGGRGENGDATGNTVTINGGSTGGAVYGGVNAGTRGDATANTVRLSGAAVSGSVFGGNSQGGNMTDNVVVIDGGSVNGSVYGGYGSSGAATGNSVEITGVAVTNRVAGGYSAGNAAGNTVTISGGSVGGTIYGGYSAYGDATGNTVNIIGAPTLAGCGIYGGVSNSGGEATTGNTLNFMGTQTINAGSISNFEYYNFWLTENTVNFDRLLIVDNNVDVAGANIDIILGGGCLLNSGDKVALISCTAGINGTVSTDHCVSTSGALVQYDFSIYADTTTLWAELLSGGALPESGALTDSRLAGSALLAQGADLVSMLEYFEVSRDKQAGYTGFAAMTGGSSTYDAGAGREIDADGFALMAGVMWDAPVRKNSLRLRAFVEAGWSDYDTDGAYGVKRVRGGGDANYYGVGVHARYQWTDEKISGLYTDASLRIGRIDSDFNTSDISGSNGVKAAYDTDSAYCGAHIGVGHIWRLNEKTSLDLSSKFLWTRIGSDEFAMSTGDRVELGSVNSSRWRTGLRVTRNQTEQLSLFAGAYYEYEFDGDANGKIYGQYRIDTASLSGGTGIGELGLVYRPAGNDRLSAMIGVQGYAGTREGFSGRLKLEYSF